MQRTRASERKDVEKATFKNENFHVIRRVKSNSRIKEEALTKNVPKGRSPILFLN